MVETVDEVVEFDVSAVKKAGEVVTDEYSFPAINIASPEEDSPVVQASAESVADSVSFGGALFLPTVPSKTASIVPQITSSSDKAVSPASDDDVSLSDLVKVGRQFSGGCKTFKAVVEGSGLSDKVVMACINFMQKNGIAPMVAQNGEFYCTMNNLSTLATQLKLCVGNCSEK